MKGDYSNIMRKTISNRFEKLILSMIFCIAAALFIFTMPGCDPSDSDASTEDELNVAAFGEYANDTVAMIPGWNVRVFNKAEFIKGSSISWEDDGSGIITLAPGIYHITAFSLLSNTNQDTTLPGYCALFKLTSDVDEMIVTGTMMNALYNTPSFIDTFLEFTETTDILLKHQVGQNVDGLFLQMKASSDSENKSSNHVFATIAIQRM